MADQTGEPVAEDGDNERAARGGVLDLPLSCSWDGTADVEEGKAAFVLLVDIVSFTNDAWVE